MWGAFPSEISPLWCAKKLDLLIRRHCCHFISPGHASWHCTPPESSRTSFRFDVRVVVFNFGGFSLSCPRRARRPRNLSWMNDRYPSIESLLLRPHSLIQRTNLTVKPNIAPGKRVSRLARTFLSYAYFPQEIPCFSPHQILLPHWYGASPRSAPAPQSLKGKALVLTLR